MDVGETIFSCVAIIGMFAVVITLIIFGWK